MERIVYGYAKEDSVLPDSGNRQVFITGAIREPATHKGRYDLLSPIALSRVAIHYENGAIKYDDRNWEKGIPASRCMSSALRHLFQYLLGMDNEDHLAAACWNVMAIMHFETTMPDMIDIPSRKKQV